MKLAHYATPHLWGRLDSSLNRLMPDRDTSQLRDPVVSGDEYRLVPVEVRVWAPPRA